MNGEQIWVGLDLGLQQSCLCVTDDGGAVLHEQVCESSVDQIAYALSPFEHRPIGLISVEAGSEFQLVRKLRARGYPVAIFEARKAKKFLAIRCNKSDESDAKGLADLGRLGRHTVSQVYLKSPECQELRSLLVIRHRLVRLRVAADGTIRSRLALYGHRIQTGRNRPSMRPELKAHIAQIKSEDGVDLSRDLEPVIDISERLRRHLKDLDSRLKARARREPVCRLLMEVPGVGPICALSFYTAIEDPARFKRSSDVGAYLGLVPKRYQSGSVSRVHGITKNGSKMTRSHLVTAAMVFRRRAENCALNEWALSLKQRIGGRRSSVALARKLAIVMLTMWKTGRHFEQCPASAQLVES